MCRNTMGCIVLSAGPFSTTRLTIYLYVQWDNECGEAGSVVQYMPWWVVVSWAAYPLMGTHHQSVHDKDEEGTNARTRHACRQELRRMWQLAIEHSRKSTWRLFLDCPAEIPSQFPRSSVRLASTQRSLYGRLCLSTKINWYGFIDNQRKLFIFLKKLSIRTVS
jgi:hypothetical protein